MLRVKARLLVTHSHTLAELPTPVEMQIDFADSATCFQMQGEFVFSFQPHAGTWAKKHYKVVTVHRFDATLNKYRTVGDYSLDKHYCNCAVAAGRYIVFSFWPFENEAVRTIWECLQVTRAIEKELKIKTKECTELKTQLEAARQETSAARQEARIREQIWREMQQRQEQQFAERMRLSDPIHIYALPDGASGMRREDWQLVLDYLALTENSR